MRPEGSAARDDERGFAPFEHELTLHLARAHELGERARVANSAAQREIESARSIVAQLLGSFDASRRP